ncbi:M50 family metallopeptidase [Bogoriella caseilytica]|uniref:Membrane-associated protease RseP (Regulator of RpoE activity) n=1 Tax=Bogoriella caseilytica TaxID=56055 RepID=A0A3N2BFL6_9MICO|nr:site-2 protease family protein [Bogoriella caseilytica]ROR74015.1 membrane-associated protease RseP (regulator of RpoE activity) [Bogoriella caseilytica]
MDFLIGVGILAFGLILSIALHEIGHLVPAKLFGVKTPQYMVGFGPTLWSTTRKGTEYGLKAIPLGGYVRMLGMFPPGRPGRTRTRKDGRLTLVEEARVSALEELGEGEQHRAFYRLSVPKKLVVMLGGPAMNLLIAVGLLAIVVTTVGVGTTTNTLGTVQQCLPGDAEATECTDADPAAPAAEAGLAPGDTVISWGGQSVSEWEDLTAAIAAGGIQATEIEVLRAGASAPETLTVTPALVERPVFDERGAVVESESGEPLTQQQPFVGISPTWELRRQPVTEVPQMSWELFTATGEIVLTLPQRLVDIAGAAFGSGERDGAVVGLVGVGRFAGEIASIEVEDYGMTERAVDMTSLLLSLNMALFVFNLIPLLPLDGGHVAGALWEGLRRQIARLRGKPDPGPVDTARLLPLTYVVVVFIIGMSLLLAYADIVRPVSLMGG